MKIKLKFFSCTQEVIDYAMQEILDTLRDDLENMKTRERDFYSNEDRRIMRAKIKDIEAIQHRVGVLS